MSYIPNEKRYDTMQYNNCGSSGLKLPLISLGLWHNFGSKADIYKMQELCFCAFDLGITHFDLANNYGPEPGSAESNFGRIFSEHLHSYRDELVISTKAGYEMWPGPYGNWGSRKHLVSSLDQSLKRMNLDYVDIFYHHRMDPNTPLDETVGALDAIVKSGKALYIGLSNYDGPNMIKAAKLLNDLQCPFIINQNKYSLIEMSIERNGLKEACISEAKGLIVFSPLAQGLLSDKYINGIPDDSRIKTDGRFLNESSINDELHSKIVALNKIAHGRGQTLAQMALAFLAHDEAVTSILIGASKANQIKENVASINNSSFSEEEITAIKKTLS